MKHFYAGYSYMGTNYAYDADCWTAYRFDTKKERDQWVKESSYNEMTGNCCAEAITYKAAMTIIGMSAHKLVTERPENQIVAEYA